jgi:hypothetical protein
MLTIGQARAALVVPASAQNVSVVQDGQFRLREALGLAGRSRRDEDEAPSYVVTAVRGLQSWVEHCLARVA